MIARPIQNNYILLLVFLLLSACSGTRHLPKGEKLYTGAEIKIVSNEKVNNKAIASAAKDAVRPLPNKGFFGIRPKLWMNNLAGKDPKTKFKKWLKKKGEPPILISSIKPDITSEIIDARLFNMGIFKSFTLSKIVEKKRTAQVVYTSHVHKPYIVKDLSYAISDDSLSKKILSEKENTLIKPGKAYNLDNFKNERLRIDAILKNNGYFYFNPDYLLFKADTSNVNRTVSITLSLKDSIPQNALDIYHINNVYVNQNYSLNQRHEPNIKDTVMVQKIVFFNEEEKLAIRPRVLSKSIYLRHGEVFSRLNHSITLNRLMSMGNFKLVQVNFAANKDSLPGLLDVNILMTPMPKHTFRAEVDLVSKSNDYTGPRMNLSVLNRNTFGGAELLNLNLAGSFEAQLGNKNLYSYSYNPQIELTFPRFIMPFNLKQSNSLYVPKTHTTFSYNYTKRVNYFDMRIFQFKFGYIWKENIRKEHELNPIDISYTSVGNKSALFLQLIPPKSFLARSYEDQFIAGGSYSFTYNEQMMAGKKIQFYFHLSSESAGNAFSLAKNIAGEKIIRDTSKIVGSVYSQFVKLSVDGRVYFNFKDKNKLVMRLFAGVGKPFGNSSVLPYTKQFFSGGPNSIRAFRINSLGPGTFNQDTIKQGFLQLGGDVKLEMNAEYRFGIYRFLKGALFVDAGNMWLLKSDPTDLGTPFSTSTFMNEIAVGTGVGLRVDVSFFILRFDLAFPLRKLVGTNFDWVANQIDFRSPTWRNNNLILNVAIGYPF